MRAGRCALCGSARGLTQALREHRRQRPTLRRFRQCSVRRGNMCTTTRCVQVTCEPAARPSGPIMRVECATAPAACTAPSVFLPVALGRRCGTRSWSRSGRLAQAPRRLRTLAVQAFPAKVGLLGNPCPGRACGRDFVTPHAACCNPRHMRPLATGLCFKCAVRRRCPRVMSSLQST